MRCLVEVVRADETAIIVLERKDRETLVEYWRGTGKMPARLKKSGLLKKMEKVDREDDKASKEREKWRKRRDTKVEERSLRSELEKEGRDSISPSSTTIWEPGDQDKCTEISAPPSFANAVLGDESSQKDVLKMPWWERAARTNG